MHGAVSRHSPYTCPLAGAPEQSFAYAAGSALVPSQKVPLSVTAVPRPLCTCQGAITTTSAPAAHRERRISYRPSPSELSGRAACIESSLVSRIFRPFNEAEPLPWAEALIAPVKINKVAEISASRRTVNRRAGERGRDTYDTPSSRRWV